MFCNLLAEANQEELLLDALSICGMPLAILGQMLAPATLLSLNLLPEEGSLEPVSPPHKYLLACKVRDRHSENPSRFFIQHLGHCHNSKHSD